MTDDTLAPARTRAQQVRHELDQAHRSGPLKTIVIPPCPELLTRMQAALAQAEPDLTEVARIAASDVAMSATLIKLANSPAFSLGQSVHTVGQAMTRLGLQKTAQEMTAYLVRTTLKVNSPQLQRFWERSTKRAVAMGHIAHHLPGLSVDLAHTYGLFAHVGMPVMMQSLRGYAGTMVEAAARIDRSYIATENANHRTDHAVVGALVARVWRLAPSVMAAIRLHHDLEVLHESGAQSEVNTLIAMGLIADYYMHRHEGLDPDVDWQSHGVAAMDWLQVSGDELLSWEEELQAIFDAA